MNIFQFMTRLSRTLRRLVRSVFEIGRVNFIEHRVNGVLAVKILGRVYVKNPLIECGALREWYRVTSPHIFIPDAADKITPNTRMGHE